MNPAASTHLRGSFVLALLMLLSPQSCQWRSDSDSAGAEGSQLFLDYDFSAPDTVFNLPGSLREISGLALWRSKLIAIEDERGRVYSIDPMTGSSAVLARFASGGDYEGVEAVGDSIYVLRSDGRLYRMQADGSDKWPHEKLESDLTRHSEWEGLGYDATSHSLLLAEKNGKSNNRRVIAYRVDSGQWIERPHMLPSASAIDSMLKSNGYPKQKLRPSALGVRPLDGTAIILSSTPSTILAVDSTGTPVDIALLADRRIRQPEGICIFPDGTLYISTEAAGDRARVFVYKRRAD